MAFIDAQRAQGYAVESICRVLSDQGCHDDFGILRPSPEMTHMQPTRTSATNPTYTPRVVNLLVIARNCYYLQVLLDNLTRLLFLQS